MKLIVNGQVYDSTVTPIMLQFDDNEQDIFNGMKKFVSAPEDSTEAEREALLMREL